MQTPQVNQYGAQWCLTQTPCRPISASSASTRPSLLASTVSLTKLGQLWEKNLTICCSTLGLLWYFGSRAEMFLKYLKEFEMRNVSVMLNFLH